MRVRAQYVAAPFCLPTRRLGGRKAEEESKKGCKRTRAAPRHFSTTDGTTSDLDLYGGSSKRTISVVHPQQAKNSGTAREKQTHLANPLPPISTTLHAASTPFSCATAFASRTHSRMLVPLTNDCRKNWSSSSTVWDACWMRAV
jgi:hypothetical protein